MRRLNLAAVIAVITIPSAAVSQQATVQPILPGWMAGCWEQRTGDSWTEECWTKPRGGMMMGSSRSGNGDRLREWEAIQIIADFDAGDGPAATMAYRASPGGRMPTIFAWSPSAEPGVTFLNATHDYPQRVRYWKDADQLIAEISLKDGSKPRRWRFKRVN